PFGSAGKIAALLDFDKDQLRTISQDQVNLSTLPPPTLCQTCHAALLVDPPYRLFTRVAGEIGAPPSCAANILRSRRARFSFLLRPHPVPAPISTPADKSPAWADPMLPPHFPQHRAESSFAARSSGQR